MPSPFWNSGFSDLLTKRGQVTHAPVAILGGISVSSFAETTFFEEQPIVVFDFETTGLDVSTCRIIEIGAIKYVGRKEVGRFSTLVDPEQELPPETFSITGITSEMLVGQPTLSKVIHQFHEFMRGCIGVAHNAEFDCGVLVHESARFGIRCDYTVVCSLKLARALVNSERKNLDALAAHYNLQFESRHRSIGDILVTADVLWRILDENPQLVTLRDFVPYQETMISVLGS